MKTASFFADVRVFRFVCSQKESLSSQFTLLSKHSLLVENDTRECFLRHFQRIVH